MEDSILKSIKKLLGIAPEDTSFDIDIVIHINSAFAVLQQLGVGPVDGFMIEDDSKEWSSYITGDLVYNLIRPYIYLRVRMLFDPPKTSFEITAMQEQMKEMEFRISANREWLLDPVDPKTVEEVVLNED